MSERPENSPENEAIWGLQDYAVFVPMTDKFYKTLKFAKISVEQYKSGDYEAQAPYADSRTYLTPLIRTMLDMGETPLFLDVGGYIGRFSIETALALKSLDVKARIRCFEPGETGELLQQNIELNGLTDYIGIERFAVSNKSAVVEFAVPSDAKITSRIVPNGYETKKVLGERWSQRSVKSIALADFMDAEATSHAQPFICKIDTEGHEVQVIEGIGQHRIESVPNVLIVEYRPALGKQQLFGQSFDEFILNNYFIFDIRNSLYPTGFGHHETFADLNQKFEGSDLDNLDLVFVHKSISNARDLMLALENG